MYILAGPQTGRQADIHTQNYICTIHAYIHTHIHAYTHTYRLTYRHSDRQIG